MPLSHGSWFMVHGRGGFKYLIDISLPPPPPLHFDTHFYAISRIFTISHPYWFIVQFSIPRQ